MSMSKVLRLPTIREHVDAILGEPYEKYDCWALARYLLKEGLDLDIIAHPEEAAQQLREIWFRGDPRDPQMLLQPWDAFIMATRGIVSNHLALVVDPMTIVHTGPHQGVHLSHVTTWLPKLVQLGRLRILM
jgi:hypothetical protein